MTEPQPVKLEFLADFYAGFNGTKMTAQQFNKLENQLKNFPAQALSRRIQNTNLNELRRTLFELDVHKELVSVLRRKYFPKVESGEGISVDEEMSQLDFPLAIREAVRSPQANLQKQNKLEN